MSIDFKQALLYPYRAENRKQTLWIPGAVLMVFFFLIFAVVLVTTLVAGDPDKARIFNFPTQLLSNVLIGGYLWRIIGQWQTSGTDAPAPPWLADFKGLLLNGLKVLLYYTALMFALVPVIIMVALALIVIAAVTGSGLLTTAPANFSPVVTVALVFLGICLFIGFQVFAGPFLWAPVIGSAQSHRLGDLFALIRAWKRAWQHYPDALIAMLYTLLLGIIYFIAMIILGITVIGVLAIPFILMAAHISSAHLINQALGKDSGNDVLF